LNDFKELKLQPFLQKALNKMGFVTLTPIQAQAIPAARMGRDLMGCAQTGTGKTVAFAIPIISQLLEGNRGTALILVPTRELAAQVELVMKQLTQYTPNLKSVLLIGGASMHAQIRALSKFPKIIVATPGRLVDHIKRKSVSLAQTSILVLDEADRMLDMGFAPQINEILKFMPRTRQTLFFSATLPPDILNLSRKMLKDPIEIRIGGTNSVVTQIEQTYLDVLGNQKNEKLLHELNTRTGSVLIFAQTQRRTDRVAKYLENYGVSVGRIHGGRSQSQRNHALIGFRNGIFRVLVATDIAARGIDVTHIAHVVNYDLPKTPEDYVHRVGRTGRAGAQGKAISLITPEEKNHWKYLLKHLKQTKVEKTIHA
jgi:ATP-dependent RNA helicase DeaD